MRDTPPPVSHGTYAGYVHGCRDRCCRQAAAQYKRRLRHKDDARVNPALIDASWKSQAACRGEDTKLFFPDSSSGVPAEVLALCGVCPVRTECLAYAIEHEQYGVWAATSERQRQRMRQRAGIALVTPGMLLTFSTMAELEAS